MRHRKKNNAKVVVLTVVTTGGNATHTAAVSHSAAATQLNVARPTAEPTVGQPPHVAASEFQSPNNATTHARPEETETTTESIERPPKKLRYGCNDIKAEAKVIECIGALNKTAEKQARLGRPMKPERYEKTFNSCVKKNKCTEVYQQNIFDNGPTEPGMHEHEPRLDDLSQYNSIENYQL